MRRAFLLHLAILLLLPLPAVAQSVGGESLKGDWVRIDSNYNPLDMMRIRIDSRGAVLTAVPSTAGNAWSVGLILWRGIRSDGSVQIRGDDGNYYPARIYFEGPDIVRIAIRESAPGNDQTWRRAGPSVDGDWERVASAGTPEDGTQVRAQGAQASIRYLPASAPRSYRVGRRLWQNIGAGGAMEVLGSDGRYYPARVTLLGADSLRIDSSSPRVGSGQIWVRPGAVPAARIALATPPNPNEPGGGLQPPDGLPSITGAMTLTVTDCPSPRVVSSNISGSMTWENWVEEADCFDYVVTANLNLGDGILKIEPGVVVGFEEDLGLTISTGGGLEAVGIEPNPIRLTGTEPERGHWRGVFLVGSDHGSNKIIHTTIEYGGAGTFSGAVRSANLTLMDTDVELVLSVLRESAAYGLYMHRDASLHGSSDGPSSSNVSTRNASGPANIYASRIAQLEHVFLPNGLSGNDRDVIDVRPEAIEGSFNEWYDLGVPYHIVQDNNRSAFQVVGALTLMEGVAIEFGEDMAMVVLEGATLDARGSAADPVVLTGSEKVRGHWRGVGSSGDLSITLNHVVIEYGGGERVAGSPKAANLQVNRGGISRVVVNNSVLRESLAYGLYAATGTLTPDRPQLEEFSGNTLTANALGAAFVDVPHVNSLMSDGSYTGNDIERVHVCSCSTASLSITGDATWRDLGVPYVMDGVAALLVNGGALTVEPGVEIRFPADMSLNVVEGTLVAVGTAEDPITFRADGEDNWRGVLINDAHGDFDHLAIHDGGSLGMPGTGEKANITIITSDTQQPPRSTARFTADVVSTGADYSLAFGYGDTYAIGCPGSLYIPPPDVVSDHCRPI